MSESKPHMELVATIRRGFDGQIGKRQVEAHHALKELVEQLEAVREQSGEVLEIREQTISDLQEQLEALGDSFVRWYLAEVFDDEAEAREEWEHIASYPASRHEPSCGRRDPHEAPRECAVD